MNKEPRAGNRKLKNMDLRSIRDLERVLKRPIQEVEFMAPEDLFPVMTRLESRRRITVHLYRLPHRISSRRTLMDLSWPSQAQYYIALADDGIKASFGDASGSLKREYHNHFIDLFSGHEEMRTGTETMVAVEHKREIISYYLLPRYAYMNIALGTNWGPEIVDKVRELRIPFTGKSGCYLSSQEEIRLNDGTAETIVFRNSMEDLPARNLRNTLHTLHMQSNQNQ